LSCRAGASHDSGQQAEGRGGGVWWRLDAQGRN
jgi:hypothetical protein